MNKNKSLGVNPAPSFPTGQVFCVSVVSSSHLVIDPAGQPIEEPHQGAVLEAPDWLQLWVALVLDVEPAQSTDDLYTHTHTHVCSFSKQLYLQPLQNSATLKFSCYYWAQLSVPKDLLALNLLVCFSSLPFYRILLSHVNN